MRVDLSIKFSKFDPRRTQWQPPGEPVKPSRAAAPRVANRVARARDEEASSPKIQVRERCHGRAARTRREELSMACCRYANEEMLSGVAGCVAQGGRLRAIAFVRATYRRCRSWNPAAPCALCPLSGSLAMHGTWPDAGLARCVPLRRSSARSTHTFSARRTSTNLVHGSFRTQAQLPIVHTETTPE